MNDKGTAQRINDLEEAQSLIEDAIYLVKQAIEGTDLAAGAEAYIIPTLWMSIDDQHEYLGKQLYNLGEMIDRFRKGNEE